MYESLVEKLGFLPKETRVFCGHEYTTNNLQFAATVDPVNRKFDCAIEQSKANRPIVPFIIEEFKVNPFMRVEDEPLQVVSGHNSPMEIIAEVRKYKTVLGPLLPPPRESPV